MSARAAVLITRAVVWTDGAPRPGADAIALAGGRVLAVGRASDLEALAGPATLRLDAGGATVTPGLTDAHLHLVQWARSLAEVDLLGSASREEAAARVAAFAAARPGPGPVVGRGWDANAWPEPPVRGPLDAACGDRPVLLHSRDFHALWVNGETLRRCGVERGTPDPAGGRIARDAAGEPTGLLIEHAVRLCAALMPGEAADDRERVREATALLNARGVTGVHDFEGPEAQRTLSALAREPAPRLRVLMHLAHAALDAALEAGLESGAGDEVFRTGALKIFADGTLGSRTAALLEPYEGTDHAGLDLLPPAELRETVRRAFRGGISVAVHAIGDRAARAALDAFEAALADGPAPALPPRIEHLQLVHPADLPRLARLGIAASMQPSHCVSDIEMAERHWGARCGHSYPWRALLDSGALLAFGSDAPVEPPTPALGIHAAVTRERPGRPGVFVPAQRITLDEALSAYTEGPARLAGLWPGVGSLRQGSVADLVVWDRDLHRTPPGALAEARPRATLIAGALVYQDASSTAPGPGPSGPAGGAPDARG